MENPNSPFSGKIDPPQPPPPTATSTNNESTTWSGNGGLQGTISSSLADDDERFLNDDDYNNSNTQSEAKLSEEEIMVEKLRNELKVQMKGADFMTEGQKTEVLKVTASKPTGVDSGAGDKAANSKSEKMSALLSMNQELEKMKETRLRKRELKADF